MKSFSFFFNVCYIYLYTAYIDIRAYMYSFLKNLRWIFVLMFLFVALVFATLFCDFLNVTLWKSWAYAILFVLSLDYCIGIGRSEPSWLKNFVGIVILLIYIWGIYINYSLR